jgi:hypothetical protein
MYICCALFGAIKDSITFPCHYLVRYGPHTHTPLTLSSTMISLQQPAFGDRGPHTAYTERDPDPHSLLTVSSVDPYKNS